MARSRSRHRSVSVSVLAICLRLYFYDANAITFVVQLRPNYLISGIGYRSITRSNLLIEGY